MQKIGVLGAGHLGKIHLNCIRNIADYELVGFYDPDDEMAKQTIERFGIKRFDSIESLVMASDVVDIVTPTVEHFACAELALKSSKHVFIEKPIVATVDEAQKLVAIADEARVKVQVGHVERFNPAFTAARPFIENPMFIETHRLAQFNPRGTDVPVVLDLMIHDIDIILSIVNSNVKRLIASGVPIISSTPDIANVRLEFDNGCVANLTASRLSLKNMRKTRIFQRDAYISVDFLDKECQIVEIKDLVGEPGPFDMILENEEMKKKLKIYKPEIKPVNAIETELHEFLKSIEHDTLPPVPLADGVNALKLAQEILEKMNF
ncbi:MAG: Gfo/Idh/MocA family oxidoreductase [Bacteroidales bacterium]|nr:Gfo/Idh/MocA family oxidoreductase [Bacteroidales bacterium]